MDEAPLMSSPDPFVIYGTRYKERTVCLAQHPGYETFRATCIKPPNHVMPHKGADHRGFPGEEWTDE